MAKAIICVLCTWWQVQFVVARRNPVQFVKLADHDPPAEADWPIEHRRPLLHKVRNGDTLAFTRESADRPTMPANKSTHEESWPEMLAAEVSAVETQLPLDPVRALETEAGLIAQPGLILAQEPGSHEQATQQESGSQQHPSIRLRRAQFLAFFFVFLMMVSCMMFGMLWVCGRCMHIRPEASELPSLTRQSIEAMPVTAPENLEGLFRVRAANDCVLFQPQISSAIVRLEGWIWAPEEARLRAPLSGQTCVVFNAVASEVRGDALPKPAASCRGACEFYLELHSPGNQVRCKVNGGDVSLFDTTAGRYRKRVQADRGQERLKEFMRLHSFPHTQALQPSTMLDFTENRLEIGALVTCVGELRRGPSGELLLGPLQGNNLGEASPERRVRGGLTSWEQQVPETPEDARIMISDDPGLLRTGALFALLQFSCGDRKDVAG
mmetsp:Transcript_23967/g.44018  ORF Transcript_23967/g.44018 Transcript_23967/m.44018 type:complete len:439 (+) Transcript_23967:190-1506(+)